MKTGREKDDKERSEDGEKRGRETGWERGVAGLSFLVYSMKIDPFQR